jgi:hypothetical protein
LSAFFFLRKVRELNYVFFLGFLLLDPVFVKNGRKLSKEKTLSPPSTAVSVQNTLLQTALRESAIISY